MSNLHSEIDITVKIIEDLEKMQWINVRWENGKYIIYVSEVEPRVERLNLRIGKKALLLQVAKEKVC